MLLHGFLEEVHSSFENRTYLDMGHRLIREMWPTLKNIWFDRIGRPIKTSFFSDKHGLDEEAGLGLLSGCLDNFLEDEGAVDFLVAIFVKILDKKG